MDTYIVGTSWPSRAAVLLACFPIDLGRGTSRLCRDLLSPPHLDLLQLQPLIHAPITYHIATMSADDEQSQSGYEDGLAGGPGAPTPLGALEGVAGLTKRDVQLFIDGGYNTVESIAYTCVSDTRNAGEQKADCVAVRARRSSRSRVYRSRRPRRY